ncbi:MULTISPECIES: hypothetical protein [Rhodococcus]|uniref:hypothetical protein n=1 Tax=Rhodococcus globerulus TaxID=33008 RepID=UPI001C56FB20|nr:hypothetical protein [Rhodococcus globerulus]QXW00460.1 hypothetical protein KYT97_18815 [Rhodococcus globerulus]
MTESIGSAEPLESHRHRGDHRTPNLDPIRAHEPTSNVSDLTDNFTLPSAANPI